MKKNGNRSIPDFSKKRPTGPLPAGQKNAGPAPKAPRAPIAKPQSGSAKSGGRRGT
jgi:hypothetical protein